MLRLKCFPKMNLFAYKIYTCDMPDLFYTSYQKKEIRKNNNLSNLLCLKVSRQKILWWDNKVNDHWLDIVRGQH
jgi:hypothetical protein